MERINVTFNDVISFFNNVTNNISLSDLFKLKGLKDAWEYVFNTIDCDLTIDYIKKIHFEICKEQNIYPLGGFRTKGVGITGTSWRPKLPSECNYEQELKEILNITDKLDRYINLFCWIQGSQMFLDGNKRVANLVANKEMIESGLSVPIEYFTLLIDYYETDNIK